MCPIIGDEMNKLTRIVFVILALAFCASAYAETIELTCTPVWHNKLYKESEFISFDPDLKKVYSLVDWVPRIQTRFQVLPNKYVIYGEYGNKHVIDRQTLEYKMTFTRASNPESAPIEYIEKFTCEIGVKPRI
jgi:hypothetical protein